MAKKSLLERIGELVKEKGNRWKDIAAVVQSEGYRDEDGNPFSDNAIRKRWKRHRSDSPSRLVKVVSREDSRKKKSAAYVSDVSESRSSRMTLEEIKKLLQEQTVSLKHELQDFVRDQVKDLASQAPDAPLPQQPGYRKAAPIGERDDTGRGYTNEWRRVKLAGTVHHKLESMFQTERQAREFSVSRMLDTVLWHYFGCPPLSDEEPEK